MLSSALTFEEDLWAKTEIEEDDSSLQTAVHNWCIPKVEPRSPSPTNSDENASIYNQMTSPIFFSVPYKLKDPVVVLERCDKIWETIKLIKNVQCDRTKDIDHDNYNAESTPKRTRVSSGSEDLKSYIKYQPVLGNDNTKLPNFTFSVKSTKKVHQCTSCGKLYLDVRSFKAHSEKIHGVYIPSTRPKEEKSPEELNIQPKLPKRNKSNSIVNNANINPVEIPKKTTRAAVSSEETQTRERTYWTESNIIDKQIVGEDNRLVCILCNKRLKDMKRHLTDYHKFGCTDIMLNELEKTLSCEVQASKAKKSEMTNSDNIELSRKRKDVSNHEHPTAKKLKTVDQESITRSKRKLKISNAQFHERPKAENNSTVKNGSESQQIQDTPTTSKWECDICHMLFAPSSIYKHRRRHYLAGHTKENYFPNNARGRSAPSTMASIEQSKSTTVNNHDKKVDSKASESGTGSNNISSLDNNNCIETAEMQKDGLLELTCTCGRSFRHLNTLALHKQKCQMKANKTDEPDPVDNSFDRDSGIGINITIKKKNDSYEIVGKDDSDENKPTDAIETKDNDTVSDTSDYVLEDHSNAQSKDEQLEELETSKYSTNHSILKLEFVDEDIDVDIEDDSQNTDENNKQEKETTNHHIKGKSKRTNIRRSTRTKTKRQPFSFSDLYKGLFPNNASMELKKKECCSMCGGVYKDLVTLGKHYAYSHSMSLTCAYCEEKFSKYPQFYNHRCNVEKGGPFVPQKSPQTCSICGEVLSSTHDLDLHSVEKHDDPMILCQCSKCPERFPSICSRNNHLASVHGREACTICKQTYTPALLEKHYGYHYGLGYPCHICKVTYPNSGSRKRHMSSKHESSAVLNELIECPECFQKVKRKSYRGHARQHKTAATCKQCDKTFCSYINFRHHALMMHNAVYPFKHERKLRQERNGM